MDLLYYIFFHLSFCLYFNCTYEQIHSVIYPQNYLERNIIKPLSCNFVAFKGTEICPQKTKSSEKQRTSCGNKHMIFLFVFKMCLHEQNFLHAYWELGVFVNKSLLSVKTYLETYFSLEPYPPPKQIIENEG